MFPIWHTWHTYKPIYSVYLFLIGGGIGQVALASFTLNQSLINNAFLAIIAVSGAYTLWKTQQIKKVADATHILSNSAMGQQLLSKVQILESLSVVAHRLAHTTNNSADTAAADAIDVRVQSAQQDYEKHQQRQAIVDAAEGKITP